MEAYRTAEADLLWILNSNARVHPTTLARAVSVLCPPSGPTRSRGQTRIGLVHHVPAAILPKPGGKQKAQRGLGCLLEGCFLNGNHARQYLSLNALGVASCLMGKSNLFYCSDLEQATRRFLARNRGDNRPNNPRFDLDESDKQASLLGSSNNSSNRNQHSSFDALELFGQYLAEDNMIGQTLWDDGIHPRTKLSSFLAGMQAHPPLLEGRVQSHAPFGGAWAWACGEGEGVRLSTPLWDTWIPANFLQKRGHPHPLAGIRQRITGIRDGYPSTISTSSQ
ncbi:hypothetical protein PGT21_024668 [Puccinia graminis f. sp. tritici]|uniref:Uncharacterized protein n=1 Tax=Puccinia graminis f. sp. tritici TaxID=56615 RepID=A0A5B0Q6F1_PUCGR|nr:hypothetical protein PGT21_024668 [Puccinia graminis f. sp. tritici]KAA1122280.1 hypothetical protein PGTUg99_036089 [Puccinia graminis f. sp. tritici]